VTLRRGGTLTATRHGGPSTRSSRGEPHGGRRPRDSSLLATGG
jgi:hypothetical protein